MFDNFIFAASPSDLEGIRSILNRTELFPPEMLEEMIDPFLHQSGCRDYWLVYRRDNQVLGFLFCEPERMTLSTWNVMAIAVEPNHQSQGVGEKLMLRIEQTLREAGQSLVLVETSGLPEYHRSRAFYDRIGYRREAEIRDFYAPGEAKVIFCKQLT